MAACAFLFASSMPIASAQRVHDTKSSTRVVMDSEHGGAHNPNHDDNDHHDGKRHHGKDYDHYETRSTDAEATDAKESTNIKDRINAILHPELNRTHPSYDNGTMVPVDLTDNNIMGYPMATQKQCVHYLLSVNPHPNISVSPEDLVAYYYEEGEREGVRPDVAFAQALKETGFFRYGGTVTPDQNNYCGLGTTSATVKGVYFPSAQLGVRAHIQHLMAYASTRKPSEEIVDPRYTLVRDIYGSNTLGTWTDLNGRWAVPGYTYGQSIMEMFRQILAEQ